MTKGPTRTTTLTSDNESDKDSPKENDSDNGSDNTNENNNTTNNNNHKNNIPIARPGGMRVSDQIKSHRPTYLFWNADAADDKATDHHT
jgi:hypothetical protein